MTLFSQRYDSNSGGEREIQRTMLELLNQLDGFDSRGDVKVIMATNRIETLDPALIRPGKRLPAACASLAFVKRALVRSMQVTGLSLLAIPARLVYLLTSEPVHKFSKQEKKTMEEMC